MNAIHCHHCGGFIGDDRSVRYEVPTEKVLLAMPHTDLCRCESPLIYSQPPEQVGFPS
jgi:hypothetical protein